ncbi:uncharacterized protein LOC117221324 [Megalopta genalis]|uniref:uncharacterized protein LOC117221324 n=1 Tax=Megalopta genalis TaxID=115081 RepID=UPI003FCF4828
MSSINMRVFKTALLLVALLSNRGECLPLTNETSTVDQTTPFPDSTSVADHYDQRQEGGENYRVHVGGVVVVIAPVEALLLASAAAAGDRPNLSLSNLAKPTPSKPETEQKPLPSPKTATRAGTRLTNLLAPFLQRIRQD